MPTTGREKYSNSKSEQKPVKKADLPEPAEKPAPKPKPRKPKKAE